MAFRLFDYIDAALTDSESRDARTSRTPAVWPSEASALRIDKTIGNIVGSCQRKSLLRMIGTKVSNPIDPVGAWRWVTGRMIEGHLTTLSQLSKPNIFVAAGVRHFVEQIYLPLELDLVVIDPVTKQGCIVECKTYYGYMAKKDIESDGKPKLENLMQASMYLLEISTGKRLKEIIRKGLEEKAAAEAAGTSNHRNRIECNLEMLEQMDDGPLTTKLVYISRDECLRKEFDIDVKEDFDGSSYPTVDGTMWKIFTVNSIYDRYKTLQNYWFAARREAMDRLAKRGVVKPETLHLVLAHGDKSKGQREKPVTPEELEAEDEYVQRLETEMRALPDTFWPPAEYQWAYSPEKVEKLFILGQIGKTRYLAWKKKTPGKDRIGDWQCLYCPYKRICVPKQNPSWAYMLADINEMEVAEAE